MNRRDLIKLASKTTLALASNQILQGCGVKVATSEELETDSTTEFVNGESGTWAVGTTSLLSSSFPADSLFASSASCSVALSSSATLGPCYFSDTTGEDISSGLVGLPTQLCLRLVGSNCNPLEGYKIEVWHCDHRGVYSGDTSQSSNSTSFAGNFCTGGDSQAAQSTWYRGLLWTNENGRVNFKTCFPGWYSGRTVHIHFAVVDAYNNRKLISQFCFDDSLVNDIFTNHSSYSSRGDQDTPLSGGRDTVFPSGNYEQFKMSTTQKTDGTLLAYHTIQLK